MITFEELIDYLSNSDDVGCNGSATDVQIALTNVKLKQAKYPTLPDEYIKFVKKFNGLSNNGNIILGINTGSSIFPDIIKFNTSVIGDRETSSIILGYDDMYYLVYDYDDNLYHVIDKDDFTEDTSSTSFVDLVPYIMKI